VQVSITVDGQMLTSAAALTERFAREITQYTERKATNKVQCSLCSSPYEARQQDKSEVLFKPQQYSNKTRLDTSTVVRGICPICAIELMLRQVQQGMRAGSAQDEKPITLWLYPTYFFTAETSQVIHEFITRLHDLSLIDLLRHLERTGFTLESLAAYESFVSSTDDDHPLQYSLNKPLFSNRDPASLFFFTLRAPVEKKSLTDTDSWIVPVLYTLALPLLLDINVVATSSFVPIYSSGADFRSTAVLDAPHNFTSYVLDSDELRLDQLAQNLWRLLRLYELHLDVFTNLSYTKWKDMHWGMLNTVAKDVATDPLSVFSYYDRKQRKPKEETAKGKGKAKAKSQLKNGGGDKPGDGIPPFIVNRYMAIYEILKARRNDPMSFIRKMVDAYAAFYRASNLKAAYAVLRPLATAMDVTMDSDPKTSTDDLFLLVAGALNDDQERVRRRQAEGFDPIKNDETLGTFPERLAISRQKIEAFTELFLDDVFAGYCHGDRGILRERANRIRSAARFYYLSKYARRDQVTEDIDEPAAEL
jgi:CRISPR-associated protein Csc3